VRVTRTGPAILFGVVAITVSSWIQTLYGALMGAATRDYVERALGQLPQGQQLGHTWMMQWVAGGTALGTLAQIAVAPLLALAAVLVWAAVFHAFLLLLRAAPRGFDATLTVVGYASGTYLVAAAPVPGLAGLVAFVWFLAVAAIGLKEAQRTSAGKGWAAVLLPFGLACLCCCGTLTSMMSAFTHLKAFD
jgi:hypothetical protein